ncbi:TNF domain-containing protein [Priestia megaterium]|uniref:TNF domain-containing protein n=1 Tax=Priestia megaterium TaxID=1404 RepID=UPI00203BC0B2|nr:TNF domain-containing protein [Priestia megaterium]MCM3544077.1 TNF domain-containing protein [Priestia megaterium]
MGFYYKAKIFSRKPLYSDFYKDNYAIGYNNAPVIGVVTGAAVILKISANFRLPLTNVLHINENAYTSVAGGVIVQEDGKYFISFNTIFTTSALLLPLSSFSIYTSSYFICSSLNSSGAATFSKVQCLKKGDTFFVNVPNPNPLGAASILATGILHVIKVDNCASIEDCC